MGCIWYPYWICGYAVVFAEAGAAPMTDAQQSDRQYQLPHCETPCWPIECKCCPFGDENTTLEEIQEKYLGGIQE